jgi:hypothetical protein
MNMPSSFRSCAAVLLSSALLSSSLFACGPTTSNTTPAKDDIEDKNYAGLKACRGTSTDAVVANNVELALDVRESLHEMVVCGGLMFSLAGAVISVLIDAAQGNTRDPAGFMFDGAGTYTSPQMDVQFFLGEDTSFGKAGDIITFNVFRPESYLLGAKVDAKGSVDTSGKVKYSVTASFSGVGPGVELLGLGTSPASPIKVDTNGLLAALGKIQISSKIHVKDAQAHGQVDYELAVDRAPLSQVTGGVKQSVQLVSLAGSRADLKQTAEIKSFTISFADVGNHALDGTVLANVSGGVFPFQVLYSYPTRAEPDVVLGCVGDSLSPPASGISSGGGS